MVSSEPKAGEENKLQSHFPPTNQMRSCGGIQGLDVAVVWFDSSRTGNVGRWGDGEVGKWFGRRLCECGVEAR